MSEVTVADLNAALAPSAHTLGAKVINFDAVSGEIEMHFAASAAFCHSEVIVQGGFITGMLDAAMATAVIGVRGIGTAVPSLEIKVSFIAPGNPGTFVCHARPVHLGKSTAFTSGELFQNDKLVATSTSTAKIFSKR